MDGGRLYKMVDFTRLAQDVSASGLHSTTALSFRPLPFYKDAVLVQCNQDGVVVRVVLVGDGPIIERMMYVLDGRSSVIHQMNEVEGLRLTDDNVLEYLRFFCANLIMPSGQAMEVCDAKSFVLEDGTPIVTSKLELTGRCNAGGYFAAGSMFYSSNVFEARFHISPQGFVDMLDDDGGTPVFTVN